MPAAYIPRLGEVPRRCQQRQGASFRSLLHEFRVLRPVVTWEITRNDRPAAVSISKKVSGTRNATASHAVPCSSEWIRGDAFALT